MGPLETSANQIFSHWSRGMRIIGIGGPRQNDKRNGFDYTRPTRPDKAFYLLRSAVYNKFLPTNGRRESVALRFGGTTFLPVPFQRGGACEGGAAEAVLNSIRYFIQFLLFVAPLRVK